MKIVIVGGGTSGWSTAVALADRAYDVVVVVPEEFETIGVGESTLPSLNRFHHKFNIFKDNSWLNKCDGTLKFSIQFNNFIENKSWTHPFFNKNDITDEQIVQDNVQGEQLICGQLGNKFINSEEHIDWNMNGYHVNAIKYGLLLKESALEKGATWLDKSVKKVDKSEGKINKLTLSDDSELEADLFIDCSGFHKVLDNGNKYGILSDRLFVNHALALQIPFTDKSKQQVNKTVCDTLSAGWCWNVPLQNRLGTGYVFCDRVQSAQEAEQEFKEYITKKYNVDAQELNIRHIIFDSGYEHSAWIQNQVNIGLSSAFIEPLESTSIALTHLQIEMLVDVLQETTNKHNQIRLYNNRYKRVVNEINEFIELHYILNDRNEHFWKEARKIPLKPKQKKIIELYLNNDYNKIFNRLLSHNYIFKGLSYLFLLNYAPKQMLKDLL